MNNEHADSFSASNSDGGNSEGEKDRQLTPLHTYKSDDSFPVGRNDKNVKCRDL